MLHAELSKKCRDFVVSHWGSDGLKQVKERPISWVLYQANPHLKLLRRRRKNVPLISVTSDVNRVRLALSTEHRA